MAMIFPGMDPYLEHPDYWPGIHHALIVYFVEQLQPLLRPRYLAAFGARVYIEAPGRSVYPDLLVRTMGGGSGPSPATVAEIDPPETVELTGVEVEETFVRILERGEAQRVVTVVEVLSPANKTPSEGRDLYRRKQRELLQSDVHLVEIDLLRGGDHTVAVPEPLARRLGTYDYLVCVNRAGPTRWKYDLYRRGVRERLPKIGIPLAHGDPDVPLDIQAALLRVYELGDYRSQIDYRRPCRPALSSEDQAWAEELIERALAEEPREPK